MDSEVILRETSASSTSYTAGLKEQDLSSQEFFPLFEIDPSQAWYWTSYWQAKEAKAGDDLASGRLKRFETVEEFIAFLDSDEN